MPAEHQAPASPAVTLPVNGVESTADVAAIATDLAQSMPDVQEHAVQQAAREQQITENAPTDRNGAQFDPAIHVTDVTGKGKLTVRGTWELKRGRKAGSAAPVVTSAGPAAKVSVLGGPAAPPTPQAQQQAQQAAMIAQARMSGTAAAEMVFMIGQAIGGDEWRPMVDKSIGADEREVLQKAFGDYFVATGKTDIPPGAALTFCLFAYIAPRFAMPKTQTRFQKIKGAVVTWWTNRKLRKMGLNVEVQQKPATPAPAAK